MKNYYITWDLEDTLLPWVIEYSEIDIDLQRFRLETKRIIDTCFGDDIVTFIPYQEAINFFQENYKEDEFIIWLDDQTYIKTPWFNFSSTRTYDSLSDVISKQWNYHLMQRTGEWLLEQQENLYNSIVSAWVNEVILCDDGIFSWDTLKGILKMLEHMWVSVKEIRVVLNFSDQSEVLGIPIVSLYQPENYTDWLDERDLVYWAKNSWASFLDHDSIVWVPYIAHPTIANKKWTIPQESSQYFCWEFIKLNQEIYAQIESILWRIITLEDTPRIRYLQSLYWKKTPINEVLNLEYNLIYNETKAGTYSW